MGEQLGLDLAPDLMADVPKRPRFHGPGYEPKLDQSRLSRHCKQVLEVLRRRRGQWMTYHRLAVESDVPVGSVRTRVSNLRAWGHPIETRTRPDRFREVRLP